MPRLGFQGLEELPRREARETSRGRKNALAQGSS